jgi:hypothetical protein
MESVMMDLEDAMPTPPGDPVGFSTLVNDALRLQERGMSMDDAVGRALAQAAGERERKRTTVVRRVLRLPSEQPVDFAAVSLALGFGRDYALEDVARDMQQTFYPSPCFDALRPEQRGGKHRLQINTFQGMRGLRPCAEQVVLAGPLVPLLAGRVFLRIALSRGTAVGDFLRDHFVPIVLVGGRALGADPADYFAQTALFVQWLHGVSAYAALLELVDRYAGGLVDDRVVLAARREPQTFAANRACFLAQLHRWLTDESHAWSDSAQAAVRRMVYLTDAALSVACARLGDVPLSAQLLSPPVAVVTTVLPSSLVAAVGLDDPRVLDDWLYMSVVMGHWCLSDHVPH